MLDVDVKGPPVAGAPLLDVTGRVVAVLVRACKGPAPDGAGSGVENTPATEAKEAAGPADAAHACQPVVVGAPVSAIRTFLTRAGDGPRGLASRGEPEASGGMHGVRVVAVAPSSPAEKALLKATDLIVAVDGKPIETPESLSDVIGRHAAGDAVKLLVLAERSTARSSSACVPRQTLSERRRGGRRGDGSSRGDDVGPRCRSVSASSGAFALRPAIGPRAEPLGTGNENRARRSVTDRRTGRASPLTLCGPPCDAEPSWEVRSASK